MSDDHWFALVVPTHDAWWRLAGLVADPALPETNPAFPEADPALPETYAPLRGGPSDAAAREAEAILAAAFKKAPASAWVARLRRLGLPAELIESLNRDDFRRAILDDPVYRQLGRVASYHTAGWGHFKQIGPRIRCGPDADARPRLMLPGVGEHTTEVLAELGLPPTEIDALLDAKVARQLAG